jgi:zinc/manganese transport system substrate-binding protein
MKRLRAIMVVAVAAAITLGACGTSGAGEGDIRIVVTTSTLGDLVSNVAGGDATVEVLMPLGADPHSFLPSSQQVADMNDADLVVVNGLGLEEGFAAVLEGVVADGGRVLELGPMLDPIPFGLDDHDDAVNDDDEDHEDDGDDHSIDPHVWMDPLRMAQAATIVAAELSELDPGSDWTERGAAYASELQELHSDIEAELSAIDHSDRLLVTNHEALGYFADRYDFEVVGTVIPGGSTLGDPSSEALASLVGTMRELGVSVVFAETTRPSALADAVARELGGEVQVVELFTGSLGEPGSGVETLIEMLRINASRIAQALGS